MLRFDRVLSILEDDFHKIMKSGANNRGAKNCRTSRRSVLDCAQVEYISDIEIVSKLQRGAWVNVGDLNNSKTWLVVYQCCRVCKYKCPDYRYGTIMK